MLDEQDRLIDGLMRQPDTSNKYRYEQTQTAHWGNLSPEHRLLMALLEDAMLAIRGRRTAGIGTTLQKSARDEAMDWVERCEDEPAGFVWTCHHLGLDCEAVAKEARKAYESGERTRKHLNRLR